MNKKSICAVVSVWLFLSSDRALADLTFEATFEFSGATAPTGTPAWLKATFSDDGDDVLLTMAAINLTGSEHVKEWYFNYDDSLFADDLVFARLTPLTVVDAVTISKDENSLKATGDGKYDFRFELPNSGNRFTGGESLVYRIGHATIDLNPSMFEFLSAPAGGHGPFHHAAHVGGIGSRGEDSGWVTGGVVPIPAPAAVALGMIGLGSIPGLRRRFN